MHVEDIASTPGSGIRIILDGMQVPFGPAGHRIDGDAAQKAFLAATGVLDAPDKSFEVRGIIFAAICGLDQIVVGVILVLVDSIAHFAEIPTKLGFFRSYDGKTKDR